MAGRFDGKVAVITGGAGGIGKATAVRLASEGASVVLVDIPESALEEALAAVERAGGKGKTVAADVTRAADVERYAREAKSAFGGVDLFFNNAGIEGVVRPLTEYPEDVFDRVIAVNLKGVWLGMKYLAPAIQERGGGAIVNTASVAGLRATPSMIAYGASKHAVIGMTKSAAAELAPARIRVNAVCPGPIQTRMMRSLERGMNPDEPESVQEMLKARMPLGRYGEAEEVAALVAFLFSDDASYISGAAYTVDGGMTA